MVKLGGAAAVQRIREEGEWVSRRDARNGSGSGRCREAARRAGGEQASPASPSSPSSPSSPASPASEARARVVFSSNRMDRLKQLPKSVPVSCKIQEATAASSSARARKARRPTLPPPLRSFEHKGRRDGGTGGRPAIRGPPPAPADPSRKLPVPASSCCCGFFFVHWAWREKKNRPVDLRLISA